MNRESNQPADLVARIMAGDGSAEETLVRTYVRGIRFYLQQSGTEPSLIDDLVQDTFLTALQKIRGGEVQKPDSLGSFLRGIAHRLMSQHYRKESRRRTDPDADLFERVASEERGPFDQLRDEQLIRKLQDTIDELPTERDRILLRRHFFDGASKAQLCEELGLEPAHFDRVKHRAIKRLVDRWKDD